MKILMYGWEFPPHISGGLGVACFGLTQALRNRGHEVTFVLPRLKEGMETSSHVNLIGVTQYVKSLAQPSRMVDIDTTGFIEGIQVREIDSLIRPYITEKEYLVELSRIEERRKTQRREMGRWYDLAVSGDYGPNLMAEVVRYAQVAGAIAAEVPHDVIHAHDWLTMLAGVEAKRVSGRPLAVHVHALEFDRSGQHVNQAVYDIEKFGMERADRVIAVSHYTREIILKRYGIEPSKVEVVHNAITRKHTPIPLRDRDEKREKVVLFLGRITFQKGPDYFVEAAAEVLKHRKNVRFVMAGSGDMASRMIQRVAQLRMGRKFHFTGFLTGAAVERMYLLSDFYVMPSVSEPFGISPLEAMCYDVPVIISRQSGVSEVLKHALKVDFWDIHELAGKIIALLDHPPLREELLRQGARELEGIQWDNAGRKLTEIYGQITHAS